MKKFCKILVALFLATLVTGAAACENSITDVRNRMREAEERQADPEIDEEFSQPEPEEPQPDETPAPDEDEEPPVRLPHKRKPKPYPLPHGTALAATKRTSTPLRSSRLGLPACCSSFRKNSVFFRNMK